MKRHKVSDDEDVVYTANSWLEDQQHQFFYKGIRAFEKRWTKCISMAGDYVVRRQNMMCVSRS